MPNALVADDDPLVAGLVRRLLERLGWDVRTAGTGEAALLAARLRRPGLAVVDVQMPGMGGLALRERLLEGDPATRVILTSGADPSWLALPPGLEFVPRPDLLSALAELLS